MAGGYLVGVAIDTSGELWRGESADDIADYLKELAPGGYPVHQVVNARCASCTGGAFVIELDEASTCARRTCVACGAMAYMLDSEEYWISDEDTGAQFIVECECGSDQFEASVGFSFYADDSEIRWVSIGVRCTTDGGLGCCADWKIGYGPSRHLLGKA
jgi:hypothetical protein